MKKFALILVCMLMMVFLAGCNKQVFDITYEFDTAIISLPNGEIVSGTVTSWKDYTDGGQIQVVIDEKTYMVHSSNIALIKEE